MGCSVAYIFSKYPKVSSERFYTLRIFHPSKVATQKKSLDTYMYPFIIFAFCRYATI